MRLETDRHPDGHNHAHAEEDPAMPTVRIRLTGPDHAVSSMIAVLHGLEGIEHVEEVADLMPHMDDDDSSSAGLHDVRGLELHAIEVETPNRTVAERVKTLAEAAAVDLQTTIEIVDEF
jgi:hypothetical protein